MNETPRHEFQHLPLDAIREDAGSLCFEFLYIEEQCALKAVSKLWRKLVGLSLARERAQVVLREARGGYAAQLENLSRACPRIQSIVHERMTIPFDESCELKEEPRMIRSPLWAMFVDETIVADIRLQDVARAKCAAHLTSLRVQRGFECQFGDEERQLCMHPSTTFPSLNSLRLDVGLELASQERIAATLRELSTVWQYVERIDELNLHVGVHQFDRAIALHFEGMRSLRGLCLHFREDQTPASAASLAACAEGVVNLGSVLTSDIEDIHIHGGWSDQDSDDEGTPKAISDAYDAFTAAVARRCPHLRGGVNDDIPHLEKWLAVSFSLRENGPWRTIRYARDC